MKVLICGGAKTENIATALRKKLESSGIDFIVVPFIEDVQEIFSKGEYFHRAIVIEQSWTHDNAILDGYEIRNKINSFANQMANINSENTQYVFLSQTNDMASIVSEETMSIARNSVNIVKEPKYFVNFFAMLVTYELDQMPTEYIYNPDDGFGGPENGLDDGFEPPSDTEVEYDYKDYNPNFDEDVTPENANRLPIDEGGNFEYQPETPADDPWGSDGFGVPGGDLPGLDNDGFEPGGFEDAGFGDGFNPEVGGDPFSDPDLADDGFNNPASDWENPNVRESGEIPDYSGPDTGFNGDWAEPAVQYPDPTTEEYPSDGYPTDGYPADEYPQDQYPQDQYPQQDWGGDYDNGDYPPAQTGVDLGPSDDDYGNPDKGYDEDEEIPTQKKVINRPKMNNKQIKATFDAFASRGTSIVVTGCGGSGTSTVALNLANTICNLGYTVLLVDMDTINKAQSYISKDNSDAIDFESSSVMAAVNSSTGANTHMSIVRQGFHLLGMGMGSDSKKPSEAFKKDKLNRFIQSAKNSHNFVIYDIPFEYAVDHLDAITYAADNIVLTVDTSNWGISKTLINICNIGSDDMEETLFGRAQLLFNRYKGINNVFGKKVKKIKDITAAMDKKVFELVGEDLGYYFSEMHVCGAINEDKNFESGWFNDIQYSDTNKGFDLFVDILKNIVLHT